MFQIKIFDEINFFEILIHMLIKLKYLFVLPKSFYEPLIIKCITIGLLAAIIHWSFS